LERLSVVSSDATWKTIIDSISLNVKTRLAAWLVSKGKSQDDVDFLFEKLLYPVPFNPKMRGTECFHYICTRATAVVVGVGIQTLHYSIIPFGASCYEAVSAYLSRTCRH
jgi:hypothetical protein